MIANPRETGCKRGYRKPKRQRAVVRKSTTEEKRKLSKAKVKERGIRGKNKKI